MTTILSLCLGLLAFAAMAYAGDRAGLHAVYIGQDGHDYCSPGGRLGADDIQDLHLRLEGIEPDQRIVEALFSRRGGGEWMYWDRPEQTPHFRAQILREPGASAADVFLAPSNDEKEFDLDIVVQEGNGKRLETTVHCGRSDPDLFMPQVKLGARWIGQEGHDLTRLGPAVGPDGRQDARIDIEGLSKLLEIRSIHIDGGPAGQWECGSNRDRVNNAELVWDADDDAKGSIFFSPAGDLRDRRLMLKVTYVNGRSQSVPVQAGTTDASLGIPAPTPIALNKQVSQSLKAKWDGQDGQSASGATRSAQGDIHVELSGQPPDAKILAATISDPYGGYWIWCPPEFEQDFYGETARPQDLEPLKVPTERRKFGLLAFKHAAMHESAAPLRALFDAFPLRVQRRAQSSTTDFYFTPFRNEQQTRMTLRVLFSTENHQQSTTICSFDGGSCDLSLCGQMPAATSVDAHPGDDLRALVARAGHIHLSPGIYTIEAPLVLNDPVAISGPHDAVLQFSQPASAQPWRDAIELAASNITLRGFSIRFATPVRWDMQKFGSSAVLMAVSGRRSASGELDPLANLSVEKMDIESAALAHVPEPGREQPYSDLMRFGQATSGKIIGNTLRGGTTDVMHGPWEISDNIYRGAMPGTMVWDAFAAHYAHDLVVARNHVAPVEPCGKTWRFFVLTQTGNHIAVTDNTVQNIGMKDADRLENPNAPEIVLTESYRLNYEGRPAGVCADGRIVQIPLVLYGRVSPGCVLSILSGPHAGQYFRIAQPLSPTAFLLDQALPPDLWKADAAISIGQGFSDGIWERNVIDARDGGSALFVLAGNHWNQRVSDNHLIGGNEGMRIAADATECPGMWGWSRTPMFDLTLDHNLCEDARRGIGLNVSGDVHAKTIGGRTYLTANVRDNTIRWSSDFLEACRSRAGKRAPADPLPIHLGLRSGPDPLQMRVHAEGNVLQTPASTNPGPPVIVKNAIVATDGGH